MDTIQSGKVAGLQVRQPQVRQIQVRHGVPVLRRDLAALQDAGRLHERVTDLFRPSAGVARTQMQRVCLQYQPGDQPRTVESRIVGKFLSDAHEFRVAQDHTGNAPGNGNRLAHHLAGRDHEHAGLRSPAPCSGRPRHAHGERRTLRKAHPHLDPPAVGDITFLKALRCRDEGEGSARVPIQQQCLQTIQAGERARGERRQVVAVQTKRSQTAHAGEYSFRQSPQAIVVQPKSFQTDQPREHPGGQRRQAVVVQSQGFQVGQTGKVSDLQRGEIPSGQIQTRHGGQVLRRDVGALRDVRDRFQNPVPDWERPGTETGCRGQDGGRHDLGIAGV